MKFPRLASGIFDLLWSRIGGLRDPDFVVGATSPGGPYLRRWFVIPRNPIFNIYLHQFLRDDDDRALHDHPWLSCSLMLHGSYIEHTIADGGIHHRTVVPTGTLRFMRPTHAHRVELLRGEIGGSDEPMPMLEFVTHACWTLFITGPRIRRWGFHCAHRGWVDFEQFTQPGNTGETGPGCDA